MAAGGAVVVAAVRDGAGDGDERRGTRDEIRETRDGLGLGLGLGQAQTGGRRGRPDLGGSTKPAGRRAGNKWLVSLEISGERDLEDGVERVWSLKAVLGVESFAHFVPLAIVGAASAAASARKALATLSAGRPGGVPNAGLGLHLRRRRQVAVVLGNAIGAAAAAAGPALNWRWVT